MRPLTVLFGFVLGTSLSATFSLSVLSLISLLLSGSYPVLAGEAARLLPALIGCAILTAAAAASFVGQLRLSEWRRYAHLATVAAMASLLSIAWLRTFAR
jgi:hypothetical protein